MDRELAPQSDALVLPSRRAALDRLAQSWRRGPVLVTGEAGIGKTWLARRAAEEWGSSLLWAEVDLSPAGSPDELLRAIAHSVGLDIAGSRLDPRLVLAEALAEQAADGRRWGLRIDESQLASPIVLEEVRVLTNRFGQAKGFAAIVLIGQTPLMRRMDRRTLSSLEARLAYRVHLPPIDAAEAAQLLTRVSAESVADQEIDRLHQRAAGNPQRLLRLASSGLRILPAIAPPLGSAPVATTPPLLPSRPPLREEEGMIEVGWAAEPEVVPPPAATVPIASPATVTTPTAVRLVQPANRAEETVQDHYAALQAWEEWARNQGRGPAIEDPDTDDAVLATDPSVASTPSTSPLDDLADVWADAQQEFAPYGSLFSKSKQGKDQE